MTNREPTPLTPRPTLTPVERPGDDVRWLALLIRRALLMICAGIDSRYGREGR